ncbi:hypothetical protein Landi51_07617 [Colletotrichum acutatum]
MPKLSSRDSRFSPFRLSLFSPPRAHPPSPSSSPVVPTRENNITGGRILAVVKKGGNMDHQPIHPCLHGVANNAGESPEVGEVTVGREERKEEEKDGLRMKRSECPGGQKQP